MPREEARHPRGEGGAEDRLGQKPGRAAMHGSVLGNDPDLRPITRLQQGVRGDADHLRAFAFGTPDNDGAEAADALLAMTGPGSGSPQVLVEVRQMGGAVARVDDASR